MRLKGVSWIEQHFEKLFAGVFGLAMLGVLAWQFLSPEPTVKLGTNDVSIHSGYDRLRDQALRVDGQIKRDPSGIPELQATPAIAQELERFRDRLAGPVSPVAAFQGTIGDGVSIDSTDVATGGSGKGAPGLAKLGLPELPAPALTAAAPYMASIHPLEIKRVPELAQYVPTELPYDAASVTVEGAVSGTVLREALASDPDGEGPLAPLRTDLWDGPGRLQLLAVKLERETLQPDGTWGEPATIKPMPGRFNLADTLAKPVVGVQGMREIMDQATRNAEQIRRPPFLAIFQGPDWTPPSERKVPDGGNVAEQIDRARRQFVNLQRERERLEKQLGAGGGGGDGRPGPRAPRDPAPPAGGGGGAGTGGGGKGPGDGRPPRTPPRDQPNPGNDDLRKKNIERRIADITAQQDQLIIDLKALGDDTSDLRPEAAVEPSAPSAVNEGGALLEVASVRVWAHDVTVERGKTYRYRISFVLNNPLFQQLALLNAEQAGLASVAAIESNPSPWSAPVGVADHAYYFVTGANPAEVGMINRSAGASVELYKFHWGFWRPVKLSLEPGDRVESDQLRTPDYTAVAQAILDAADKPDQQRDPGGNDPNTTGDAPPIVALTVRTDAALLNVAPGRDDLIAFFRSAGGSVVERRPQDELQNTMLLALRASAEQGERATRPKIGLPAPGQPGGDDGRDPRQPDEPKTPFDGGGGSGLGGG